MRCSQSYVVVHPDPAQNPTQGVASEPFFLIIPAAITRKYVDVEDSSLNNVGISTKGISLLSHLRGHSWGYLAASWCHKVAPGPFVATFPIWKDLETSWCEDASDRIRAARLACREEDWMT